MSIVFIEYPLKTPLDSSAESPHSRRSEMKRVKAGFFVLEGVNAFVTSYFFNYLLFLFRDAFHFGNRENLTVGAVHGLIYIFAAWYGGRFAEKHGRITALYVGFGGMALALAIASFLPALPCQIAMLLVWTISMCFTWPALEALVSEGEDDAGLPRMIGIYNLVWAGMAGLGYFFGGAIFETLGRQSLYWLPVAVHIGQLGLLVWLTRQIAREQPSPAPTTSHPHHPEAAASAQGIKPEAFLKMAWVANPFAYIAINTLLAIIPDLARRFGLSPTWSGIFCSIWFFTRFLAFLVLWRWTGWHYRFRYLIVSYVGLIAGFLLLLLARDLWLVIVAQVFFGASTGLIYYSSLFYSMDVGQESQGAHGGLHEAAIGAGICAGPALGATALRLAPQSANVGTYAVGGLLLVGMVALIWMRQKGRA
ncbi:MAG: MFS transporter [Verrucomicrobiota bacterium]